MAAMVSGPSAEDQLLQALGAAGRELLLGLARLAEAVVVRAVGVQDAGDRQVEILVDGRQAGQRSGRDGDAVIGLHARDELLLLRPAEAVVQVAHHLDDGVVGLGARVAEIRLGHRHRRQAHQLLRQLGRDRRRLLREGVIVGQFLHLAGYRLGQARHLAEAERAAPQAGQPVHVFLAVLVIDVDALAAGDDEAAVLLVLEGIGVAVEVESGIFRRQGIRPRAHGSRILRQSESQPVGWLPTAIALISRATWRKSKPGLYRSFPLKVQKRKQIHDIGHLRRRRLGLDRQRGGARRAGRAGPRALRCDRAQVEGRGCRPGARPRRHRLGRSRQRRGRARSRRHRTSTSTTPTRAR